MFGAHENLFWSAPAGLELSRYTLRGAFPTHLHRRAVVVVVEQGAEVVHVGSETILCVAGDIVLLAAEEVHRNRSFGTAAVRYRVFYVETHAFATDPLSLSLRDRWIRDPVVFARLSELHRCLETSANPSDDAAAELLPLFADRFEVRRYHAPWVSMVARLIREQLTHNLLASDLAYAVGMSEGHVAREFKRELGLTPHAYRDALRVERARDLIRAGIPTAQVAALCGFCDQSHLIRRFRRLMGATPAHFAPTSQAAL